MYRDRWVELSKFSAFSANTYFELSHDVKRTLGIKLQHSVKDADFVIS